jgi:hypothetical protein
MINMRSIYFTGNTCQLCAAKIVIQPAGTQSRSGRFTPCIFKANDFAILIVFCSRKPWTLPYSDKE